MLERDCAGLISQVMGRARRHADALKSTAVGPVVIVPAFAPRRFLNPR
jgi:hypothetical protein